MPAPTPAPDFTARQARLAVARALSAYRAVQFSTKTGVRAYFAAKEAARADVLAAIADARDESFGRQVAA